LLPFKFELMELVSGSVPEPSWTLPLPVGYGHQRHTSSAGGFAFVRAERIFL